MFVHKQKNVLSINIFLDLSPQKCSQKYYGPPKVGRIYSASKYSTKDRAGLLLVVLLLIEPTLCVLPISIEERC